MMEDLFRLDCVRLGENRDEFECVRVCERMTYAFRTVSA